MCNLPSHLNVFFGTVTNCFKADYGHIVSLYLFFQSFHHFPSSAPHTWPKSTYGKAYICCDVLPNVWDESILYSILCVCVTVTQMLDKSSWQDNEARRVFGLHRVNMVIWVLKLLLLPIDGCWYLVSEPMYLCRCHLLHFLLISPWTWNRLEQKGQLHVYSVSRATCSLPT